MTQGVEIIQGKCADCGETATFCNFCDREYCPRCITDFCPGCVTRVNAGE